MIRSMRVAVGVLAWSLALSFEFVQAQTPTRKVTGSGTVGQIPIWVGSTEIGDSLITQSGVNVGIRTTSPGSTLTVAGVIESSSGGILFPDGTVQDTAGLSAISHNDTLSGNGTSGAPLGVAVPLRLSGIGLDAVISVSSNFGSGMLGISRDGNGLEGRSSFGSGVIGRTGGFAGVLGVNGDGFGVLGRSDLNFGVRGETLAGIAVFGSAGSAGKAGVFTGDVQVTGTLSKGGGSFKIDHPLDPANKYLYHSFVESPDMMNIYNGNVTTDASGEATVTLPEYFVVLNGDYRYQLTVIGQFAQAIVASEIQDNRFTIRTNKPSVKVSWQVTGIRQDAWAKAHRIPVEEEKPDKERGYYLHPELLGQPEEKSIYWAQYPEQMRRAKEEAAKQQAAPTP